MMLSDKRRLLQSVGVGLIAAGLCWLAHRLPPRNFSDFDQFWVAGRALLAGQDPYAAVSASNDFPLLYPLPAVLLTLPFSLLPLAVGRVAWTGAGAALLAWTVLRRGGGAPVALLGAPFLTACVLGQWSPLLAAGLVLPWLAAAWIAKPSLGLACFGAYPSRRAAVSAGALLALSFAAVPGWLPEWFGGLRSAIQTAPVLHVGGVALLGVLWRWRDPNARLVALMACVPQTLAVSDMLLFSFLPQSRKAAYAVTIVGYLSAFAQNLLVPHRAIEPLAATLAHRWPFLLAGFYVPAAILVLTRPRAHEGS